ncbi:MAG TPA: inner-membrane translocator [Bdellovibrionota bacterium]|nr:inner-membrane translocator [Bdellovibrionota bacterium]
MNTAVTTATAALAGETRKKSWAPAIDWRFYRSIIALGAVMVILAFLTDGTFLTPRNITNLTRQVAINGILAIGMTYVILIGGIDLSIGSVVALAGVMAGVLQVNYGLSQWTGGDAYLATVLTIAAAVITGLFCGVFNGYLITRHRIAPFIITLGMMVIARGLALIFANGAAIAPLSEQYGELGQGYIAPAIADWLVGGFTVALVAMNLLKRNKGLAEYTNAAAAAVLGGIAFYAFHGYRGLPIPVLIFGALGLTGILILQRTRLGRFVLAIGGNAEAAWLAGVPIRKITFGIYIALGALAGLSGAILSARLNGALPTAGELFELDAIAAVVIGGTSLVGGLGTVRGSILGAFFIGALNNGMSLLDITEFYQKVIKGVIIIMAVWFDMRQAGGGKKS